MVLITSPAHPFGRVPKICTQVINGQKFIGFEQDIPSRRAIDKVLKEKDVEVKYIMEFDNVETVKRAVEIDAGISIVPRVTVAQEVAKGTLSAVEFEDADFSRPIAAIYRKNKFLSPAMKEFLTVLKSELGDDKQRR
jgi:DNA-binding transcriptional LysR family regulator